MCIEMNRDAILIGEIGALLHDIGKLHLDFVKSKSVENIKGLHHAREIDKFINGELIGHFKNLKINIGSEGEGKTIYDLIRYHHDAKGFILECLEKCDKKDSADDKGIVRKKQYLADTWIASPFGYKKEKIDLVCLQKRFENLEDILIGLFKSYISGTISPTCFRESLMKTLEVYFSHALGETRIPSNDVTLWDHSYSTASLFKSLLAAKVCGANIDIENPQWRISGVCWDGIEFINRGKKIAEIKAREEIIENIKKELKKEFEDAAPIGNTIYEDTNGIYFTFPNLNDKSKELARECAEKALEIIYRESNNELWPFFTLSRASATLTTISEELKFASEKRKIPKISPTLFVKKDDKEKEREEIDIESNFDMETEFERLANKIRDKRKDAKIDICPVCRIRPKDEKAERCEICEDRRMGRLEQWLSNRQNTVWIDEIADKNNRVALISLNFCLDNWLDGTMIGTLYSQSFEDWKNGERYKKKTTQNILKDRSIKQTGNPEEDALNIAKWIAENQRRTEVKTLLECFMEDGNADNVPDDIKDDANNILSWFFTQNPSPARLYRIWKETEEFFDLIVRKIRDEIYSNKWRRVRFTVSNSDLKQKLKDTTTYILKTDNSKPKIDNLKPQNLLVFHNKDGEFYTIESLEKFEFKFNNKSKFKKKKGEEAVKEALKNGFDYLALEDEPDKNLLKFSSDSDEKIKPDEKSIETEEYYPLIEINRSPLSLRLIVPASDSMKITELITKLYNERFEKVLGKLPLNIKLLVAKRKFPLYVLLDAEKRMLEGDEFKTQEPMNPWWNVDGHRYGWYYSFYPTKTVEAGEKYTLDVLSSISKGEIFHLYPGYFDFELLLGTTDRYGIYYKGKNRGGEDYKLFSGRPYYFYQVSEMLELWDILSENLSLSQINFIEEMLTSKLREWRDIEDGGKRVVFMEFAEAILKDAFDRKWNNLREETKFFLVNSAINGLLLDTIILFRHVTKYRGEENE
ncbi:MAG: CRISPR-associated protein Csx11 [Candidatus Methanophagaceae archaeon]|nr:MAG: CRISPR-associated protein Csx11 [Methanophagales archaeon]